MSRVQTSFDIQSGSNPDKKVPSLTLPKPKLSESSYASFLFYPNEDSAEYISLVCALYREETHCDINVEPLVLLLERVVKSNK